MSRHLELETLSALLDAELEGAEAERAQAHLGDCAECKARLDGLRSTVSQLRSLPAATPPPHVRDALRRRLAVEQEVRRRLWTLPGWNSRLAAWPAMAAAVFLAFGCGLFLYAYLIRHPSMVQPTERIEPITQEGDWRATITYERPSAGAGEAAAGAAAPSAPPAATPVPAEPRLGAVEGRTEASPPAALGEVGEAGQRRENALAKAPAPVEADRAESAGEPADPRLVAAQAAAKPSADAPLSATAEAPAPAPMAARRAASPLAASASEAPEAADEVVALGPDIERPERIAGENPDLELLRDVRLRQSLVIVECVIGKDGVLRDVKLRPNDLDPRLAAAVRKSLTTWKFKPARKDGEPVAVHYVVTLNIHPR